MKIFAAFVLAMTVFVANVEAAAQPYVVPIFRATVDATTVTTDGTTTDGTSTDGTTTAPTSTTTVSVETSSTSTQKPTIPAVFEALVESNKIRHPRSLLLVNPKALDGHKYEHVCTGTLVDEGAVITTVTCIEFATDGTGLNAFIGTAQDDSSAEGAPKTLYEVTEVIKHPNYNADTNANNIAVLKLASQVDFSLNSKVKSIPWSLNIPVAESNCITSYWHADDPYIQVNQDVTVKACDPVKNGTVCSTYTAPPSECPNGANGGSLVCADKLAGVFTAHRNADCSASLWQYEEISKDAAWIEESVSSAAILNLSFAAILTFITVVMKGV